MSDSLPPIDPAIAELHARVWTGQASADEVRQYTDWCTAHPDHALLSERLNEIWQAAGRRPGATIDLRDRVWRAIHVRSAESADLRTDAVDGMAASRRRGSGVSVRVPLDSARMANGAGTSRGLRQGWRLALAGVAAAALLWLGVTAGLFRSADHVTTRHYASASGQQVHVSLADGSQIILGAASTVDVITSARNGTSVTVNGEALFDVAHVPGRAFTVHAGHAVARVLGTRFLVRRYDVDSATQVAVLDGKVAVAQSRSQSPAWNGRHDDVQHEGRSDDVQVMHTLASGMLEVVPDSGDVTVMSNVNVEEYTALASERLIFDETPVRDIISQLGHAYGVEIRTTDTTLLSHKLTITVPVTRWPVDTAVDLLSDALGARYSRAGRVITISAGPRAQPRNPRSPLSPLTLESQYGR